jgi:hypothetical protein
MQKNSAAFFFLSSISILSGIFFLHVPSTRPVVMFGTVFISVSVMYLIMAWTLFQIELPKKTLFAIVAVSLVVRLSFVTEYPVGSEDAYRYLWDGKVQAHGINPYLYSALDEHVSFLHSPLLPAAMNHAGLKTIYFPLSEWIFYSCYQLSGEALWGFKIVLFLAEAGTIIGLFLLLSKLTVPVKFVLLYALCPLPITQFAIDAHLDAVGLFLLIFSLLCYFKEKKILSYVLLGLSISIKPVGLIVLPALLFHETGWRKRLYAAGIPLATACAQFLPYIFTSNPFETLTSFTKDWAFNGVVFETLYSYTNDNQRARFYCGVLLAIAVFLLNFKRKDLLNTIYFSILSLILFSPVVHPWYVCWAAVLLPMARRWSGIALVAGVSLTSFTIMTHRLTGAWEQYPIVLVIEYLPVILLLAFELRSYLKRDLIST